MMDCEGRPFKESSKTIAGPLPASCTLASPMPVVTVEKPLGLHTQAGTWTEILTTGLKAEEAAHTNFTIRQTCYAILGT
eukprot:1226513-Amphidinium_carterae.2